MKKSERFHPPSLQQEALGATYQPSVHGFAGHVNAGFPNPYLCPLCTLWDTLIHAITAVFPGIRTTGNIDQCSGDPRGAARCSFSIIPGPRTGPNVRQNVLSSSAKSYIYSLGPSARPNLHILVQHRAIRIVWKRDVFTPTPDRIIFETEDFPSQSFFVSLTKEVIICLGALSVSITSVLAFLLIIFSASPLLFLNGAVLEMQRKDEVFVLAEND